MIKVEKRNKEIVDFNVNKIEQAIIKSMSETEKGIDERLAKKIGGKVLSEFSELGIVNIEMIQDFVEVLLMKERPDVSKKYILYREERARLRGKGWAMSDLQKDIYEQKYRHSGETFDEFLNRVGGKNEFIKKAIRDKKFLPAGRILAGRGLDNHGRKVTLSNCYVLPKVDDSIESIFDTAKHLARTFSYGGGVGFNISKLRPRNAKVNNSAQSTTGAVSFMDLFSLVTGLIGQNSRRGALMVNMDVHHPDILEFIDVKNDLSKVTSANISVNITKDFMKAVKEDGDFELHFKVPSTGEVISKLVNARELFRKLAMSNFRMAEPGMLFWDNINSWHIMSEDEYFEFAGVNPCGEEPLPAYGSCNLSAINLAEFVIDPFTKYARFDYESFKDMVKHGVNYLNEILDDNMDNHPLKEQIEVSRDLRQIGLGIMGLADMFIMMGIKYGSSESTILSRAIGKHMINSALQQSALLAKEYGTFPKYNRDAVLQSPYLNHVADGDTMDLIEEHGLRNSQLLTIAPTGSTSTMLGISGGLEPIFQLSYNRKTETLNDGDTYYKVFTPIAKEFMEMNNIQSEEDLPKYFITSSDIDYKDRIEVQSAWQEFIDASISSTVNLPNETTVEQVEDLYMYAYDKGLKGITIYRDGCERGGILTSISKDSDKKTNSRTDEIDELSSQLNVLLAEELKDNPNVCPMCGGEMFHSGGCEECRDCSYSPCSI